ncbi:hypothetical protein V4C53_47805, partial [Paraburkholderia azotifigens]|uniref:hypothetical protein n=1 Tax=Paraburkholderia azotifigens TaxID=2057004 RepID=UPI003182AFE5
PLQDLPDPQRQRLPGNAFFLHRRFRQIFHVLILRYLLIATEPDKDKLVTPHRLDIYDKLTAEADDDQQD